MTATRNNNGTYQLITPPALKERVGLGAGIDTELARRANTAVNHMRVDFLQRVATTLSRITEQKTLADKSADAGGDVAAELSRTFRDLEMQSAALGHSLVGDICASMCGYVENLDAAENLTGKVVRAHIDALRSVVGNSIEGDGGRIGQALIESLDELVDKSSR